jgi:hypothetical protein
MSGISGGVAVSWHLGWCRYFGGQSEDDRTDHGVGCSGMSSLSFQVRDLSTFFHASWKWFDRVVDLLSHIFKMYMTMAWTVVSGLLQMLWKRLSVLMWRTPSTGSSPRRKCRAGIGDDWLSLRKPLMVLLWKISNGFMLLGRMGRAERPNTKTGRQQVLHMWICTRGDRRHLNENAGPRRANREVRHLTIFSSVFFCSSSLPDTTSPRCSLLSTTLTFSPLKALFVY